MKYQADELLCPDRNLECAGGVGVGGRNVKRLEASPCGANWSNLAVMQSVDLTAQAGNQPCWRSL